MNKPGKTILLVIVTMACAIGMGVAEVAKLPDTQLMCVVGFLAFGAAALFSAFS